MINNITNNTDVKNTTNLPIATKDTLGVVKGGGNVTIDPDGTMNASGANTDIATATTLGVVKGGSNVSIAPDGTMTATGALVQVQSDWAEANNTLPDYIKNKPTIPAPGINQLTGDVAAGPGVGSVAATLASVLTPATPGTYGDTTHVAQLTVDVKGRITNVSNVAIAGSGGSVATSFPTTQALGVLTTGVDQTTVLNAAFSNSQYKGIILDNLSGGAITINGTLNGQGKTIILRSGTYFTGTGLIQNYIHESGYKQKCYDTTLSVNPLWSTGGKFSTWWGWNGSGDAQPAFQWAIDTVVRNQANIKLVYFLPGSYTLSAPLDVYSWNGIDYQFVSIYLVADCPQTGTTLCNLNFTSSQDYGVNFQRNKGSGIHGIQVTGKFTPPFGGNLTFYQRSFAGYTDGVCRDQFFSPHAGIVVDAFSTFVPADGGYPARTAFYRGNTASGSTGIRIINCFMSNWVVGHIVSPNGQTQNGELIYMDNCNFANYKACIASCQAQEKLNEAHHIQAWGTGHTFFCNGQYGSSTQRGSWKFDGVNMAGFNVQFIFGGSGGWFPCYFTNIYAEQIGKIGSWDGVLSDAIEGNCVFDLALPSFVGCFPDWAFQGRMTFRDVTARYYGTGQRLSFLIPGRDAQTVFDNCKFESVPYVCSGQEVVGDTQGLGNQVFRDCIVGLGGGGFTLGPKSDVICQPAEIDENYCYGNYKIYDSIALANGTESILHVKNYQPLTKILLGNSTSTVTVSSNVATITPASGLATLSSGDHIVLGERMIGLVDTIGGSSFTVQYVPSDIVNGTYDVYVIGELYVFSFMGTCTSGSPTITGVVLDKGSIVPGNFTQIPGFYNAFYQQGRILAYNSGAGTITMDRNAADTGAIWFSNASVQKTVQQLHPGRAISSSEIFPKGSYLYTNFPSNGGWRSYITTFTGLYSGSPQALWTLQN